jgi:thiamine pyrophosphate-dependent acetolactate synthase large subunit-like protein
MEGILKYPALGDIFASVDLLICLGYQYVDDLLPKMWKHGDAKRVISISSSYCQKVYSKFMPDIECVCNISKLLGEMKRLGIVRKDARDLKDMKNQYERVIQLNLNSSSKELSPIQVIYTINQNLKDGILITDIGYYRHHAIIFAQPLNSGHFFSDTGLSSFGSGLPSAAAAQLLSPEKMVFLICGDGGFHSVSGDMATLVKYNLPVVIILLNNSAFELINLYQKRGQEGRNPDIVSLQQVDFAKLAEANGCSGVKVYSVEELDQAIKTFDRKKPLLIEVPITYDGDFVISF